MSGFASLQNYPQNYVPENQYRYNLQQELAPSGGREYGPTEEPDHPQPNAREAFAETIRNNSYIPSPNQNFMLQPSLENSIPLQNMRSMVVSPKQMMPQGSSQFMLMD